MNSKIIKTGNDLSVKLVEGIVELANTVTSTMGAHGKRVIIEEENGFCRTTKDGVSVAKAIKFDDPFKNMGSRLLIDSAISTVSEIGDGTTTTILLASEIYKNYLTGSNLNSREFTDLIEKQVEECMLLIDENHHLGEADVDILKKVSTISANNDAVIGDLVGEIYDKIGKDGIVFLNRSEHGKTHYKINESLNIPAGYVSKIFSNQKNESVLNDSYVLSTNIPITTVKDLMPLLQEVAESNKRRIFIIAPSFTNDAVASLYKNKAKSMFDVCIVESPQIQNYYGIGEDIAKYTNGNFIDGDTGTMLKDVRLLDCGLAKSIITTQHKTVILADTETEAYTSHIDDLKVKINEHRTDAYKDVIKERIARLDGKMCTIYVGGHTEVDHNYLYDVFDDSIKATHNCLKTGYCVGGGSVYMGLSIVMDKKYDDKTLSNSLKTPLMKIMQNSEYNDYEIEHIVSKFDSNTLNTMGFNLLTKYDSLEDLTVSGIVEPTGLIKSCIKNATVVATHLINTHSGISIIPNIL